jgi:hypothetical protein
MSPELVVPENELKPSTPLNYYANDYSDEVIKNLIDDPNVDKKTLVAKLLSHF